MVSSDYEEVDRFADEILGRLSAQSQSKSQSQTKSQSPSPSPSQSQSQSQSQAISDIMPNSEGGDDSSVEDDLVMVDKMNVHYDFSAWDSFRKSLPAEKQAALKQSFANSRQLSFGLSSFNEDDDSDDEHGPQKQKAFRMSSFNEEGSDDEDDYESPPANNENHGANEDACVVSLLNLTDEERFDNATWRMRLEVDQVFSLKYIPKKWEQKEMGAIINFLALKNPTDHPVYLNKPRQQATKDAISSIFFPMSGELQSVLLKRGPVLVDGEERELMLFTNGFVLSRVELDTLLDVLLDPDSGKMQQLTPEDICERFSDIDTDHSGSLDRSEICDYFRGIGMALSKTTLDGLMNRFDSDSDGTISLEEFTSMMNDLQGKPDVKQTFWRGIGGALKRALTTNGITRKLDAAFQMSDIERIENMGDWDSKETKLFVDPELAPLTLAVYIKDARHPLMVMCSKPGHVEAWVEAFRVCNAWHCPTIDWGADDIQRGVNTLAVDSDNWRCSTIDWGEDDTEEDTPALAKKERPVLKMQCSTVDWGS